MSLAILWENRKLIAGGIVFAVCGLVVYWYGYHIPDELKMAENKITEQGKTIKSAEGTVKLQEVTQNEQRTIDKRTFQAISARHSKYLPRNSVVVRGGVR
jgi:hypothetical protein